MNPRIDALYAFVAEDDESEGVMAMRLGNTWFPLVGADMDRIKSLLPVAESISAVSGKPFRILKFETRTDVTEEVK